MAEVFISYKQEERERMRPIAEGLRALGVDVWFDERLQPGDSFTKEIDGLIATCKAQIVCWSPAAVKSEWVLGEADKGRRRGVLISVIIEACDLPTPFNMLHSENLSGWEGGSDERAWKKIVEAVGHKIGRPISAGEHAAPGISQDAGRRLPPDRQQPTSPKADKRLLIGAAVAVVAVLIVIVAMREFIPPPLDAPQSESTNANARAALDVINQISPHEWSTVPGDELVYRVLDAVPVAALAEAAERDARAQALLGLAYDYGTDQVEQDAARAVRLSRQSADQGFVRGQLSLGSMYRECRGVACDNAEALRLYRLAAGQGNAIAQYNLAELYMEGDVVSADEPEAVRYLTLSAEQGYAPAEVALGLLHELGRGGLVADRAAAVRLYRRAANRGNALAEQQLFRLQQ